jgi:hypothetical protein
MEDDPWDLISRPINGSSTLVNMPLFNRVLVNDTSAIYTAKRWKLLSAIPGMCRPFAFVAVAKKVIYLEPIQGGV